MKDSPAFLRHQRHFGWKIAAAAAVALALGACGKKEEAAPSAGPGATAGKSAAQIAVDAAKLKQGRFQIAGFDMIPGLIEQLAHAARAGTQVEHSRTVRVQVSQHMRQGQPVQITVRHRRDSAVRAFVPN